MTNDDARSSMMDALQVQELASNFSGCKLVQLPVPEPAAGEVIVKIEAAALGFPDLLMTQGGYQAKPQLPFIPGTEISGTITDIGAGVEGHSIGDAVVTSNLTGGFAQYGAYPAERLIPKPENLSFAEAAGVGAAYLTAYVSLVRRANIQEGEWLLVHGAAGGVGLAAVDLGLALGAKVIAASASSDKLKHISDRYNPDAIIDSSDGFREKVKDLTGGRGADVIFDPVGGDVFDESTRCIAFDGRLLVIGFAGGRIANVPTNIPLIKGFSVVGVRAGEYGRKFPERGKENVEAIWELAAKGTITPHVHAKYPLSEWRAAFAQMEERKVVGRVVIAPGL